MLSDYAPIPLLLDFPEAAALPAAIETATRALDQLGVASGSTLLINGASGSIGGAAVQLAVARGARAIGTAGPAKHEYLRSLGAEPPPTAIILSSGFARSRPTASTWRLTSQGAASCQSSSCSLGGPEHAEVRAADYHGAQEHGVKFSTGEGGAVHALAEIGGLIESGRFSLPVVQAFPLLADVAEAHRVGEEAMRAELVRVVGR